MDISTDISMDIHIHGNPADPSSAHKALSYEPCQLCGYWTKFHEIFTQYTGIICAVNAHS